MRAFAGAGLTKRTTDEVGVTVCGRPVTFGTSGASKQGRARASRDEQEQAGASKSRQERARASKQDCGNDVPNQSGAVAHCAERLHR